MFPDGLPEVPVLTADETAYLSALEAALYGPADSFDPYLDLLPLPEDAISGSRVEAQYARFEQAVRESHLMAVMRLGMESTPFDPASHTIGVHNIALHTAILAKKAGFPVDLPLVSAAALGHDIGKFGCRGEDLSRIAYLHYYYTWQWFSRHDMEEIGYISANHSTWDLEFENLPIESLLLIYADFRVRGTRAPGEKERMRIYSLKDAYEMIFCKLADMTPEKTLRYQNVYHKLSDFENLLRSRGVGPELTETELLPHETKDPSLMNAEQALQALRDLTLDGSIRLMHTLSTDQTLEQLLEQAKGEKNLQRIRMYLRLLEEYSTYMTKANKRKTLVLLYELLMHPDGDVRRIAGRIMGKILANAGPRYRKERPLSAKDGQMPPAVMALLSESAELWTHYIGLCLHPDYRISSKHALRISNSLKTICQSLFASCEEKEAGPLVKPLLNALTEARDEDRFVLVDALCHVPCRYLPKKELPELSARLAAMLGTGNTELDIITLHMLLRLTHAEQGLRPAVCAAVRQYAPRWEDHLAHDWLKARLLAEPFAALDARTVSQIHLSNLKNAVHWTVKLTQINMLLEYVRTHPETAFHTALHFSNLLCVSEHLPVREAAGNALLSVAPDLLVDQINEIGIDLTRELESGQEQISRFIPPYLGRLLCLLPEKELGESVESIGKLACGASIRPARVALFTLGEALNVLPEQEAQIADHILGLILTGISHYDETIHQTALAVLCRDIFGRDQLSLARKHDIFVRLHKKLLTLLAEPRTGQLTFFNCAAMLNHLYRYTVRQELLEGPFRFPPEKPAAFFPGTFDPFSVGHKQIVQEIRARGFEVYLAVDEFSWSKKTLPKLLRRRIVSISTADQWDTYLFPDEIPVNIAMPDDLARLRQLFPGRDVYLVAGSDVIANASAYKHTEPGTAADYDHIIFWPRRQRRPRGARPRSSGESSCFCRCRRFMRRSARRASAPRSTRTLIFPCSSHRSCRRIFMNAACTSVPRSRRTCCGAKRSISEMSRRTSKRSRRPSGPVCGEKKRPARRFCWQDLRVCSAGRRDIRFCWTICMTRSALWMRAAMCASTPPARSCSLTRRRPRGRTRCGCSSTSCLPEVLSRGTPMRSAAVGKTRRSCRVPCASSALHRPQTASIMSICATPSCSCRTPCSASSPRTATHPLCARPFCRPGPACAWRSAPCSLASSFCASTRKCSIRPLPNALSA